MKKYLVLVALLVILVIPFVGCMETETPAPPVPPKSGQDDGQNTKIAALENDVANLKKQNPTDTYTKAQIDEKIAQADTSPYTKEELDDFFDDLWVEVGKKADKSGSSSSSSNGDYGTEIDHDGELVLYLDSVDPASDPVRMSSGVDEVLFDIVVVNEDDRSHKYDLSIRMTPEDDCKVTQASFAVDVNPNDFEMSGDRSDWDTTLNDNPIYIDNDDDIWIGGSEVEHYSIAVEFNTTAGATYWEYKLFIEDKS